MPPAQPVRIPITSSGQLTSQLKPIEDALSEKETEHSWQKLDKALTQLEVVTKNGGYKFEHFVSFMNRIAGPLARSLLSERTKLSGTAADVIASVAPRLGERFEPLLNCYIPPLLQLCARTNKVAYQRAQKCLLLIVKHCKLPAMLPFLGEACKDKFAGLRIVALTCMVALLEYAGRERLEKRVAEIEAVVKITARDSNPEVRQYSRRLFEHYKAHWPQRSTSFTAPLSPTTRRYLALPRAGSEQDAAPSLSRSLTGNAVASSSSSSSNNFAPSSSTSSAAVKTDQTISRRPRQQPDTQIASFSSSSGGGPSSSSSKTASGSTLSTAHPKLAIEPTPTPIRRSKFSEQAAAARERSQTQSIKASRVVIPSDSPSPVKPSALKGVSASTMNRPQRITVAVKDETKPKLKTTATATKTVSSTSRTLSSTSAKVKPSTSLARPHKSNVLSKSVPPSGTTSNGSKTTDKDTSTSTKSCPPSVKKSSSVERVQKSAKTASPAKGVAAGIR
ncbi:unnamed protein product [Sympodiomycopsis kandeliae]